MAHKIIEDTAKSFKVQRDDGKVIHVAKTAETEPLYMLCKGGMPGYADGGLMGEAAKLAPLAMLLAADGGAVGKVPGKAKVQGDSPKNDVVNARLSPGEIVIPRTVVAKGPQAVVKFVQDALAGKHPASPGVGHDAGGNVAAPDDSEYNGIDKTIGQIWDKVSPYIDTNPTPVDQNTSGSLQVQGAPLQNAQEGYEGGGYDPSSNNPDPAPQVPVPASELAQAGVPNTGGAALLDNASGSNKPDKIETNVGAPDGTGHVAANGGDTAGSIGPGGYPMVTQTSTTTSDKSMTPDQRKALGDFTDSQNANIKAQTDAATSRAQLQGQQAGEEARTIKANNDKFDALEQQKNEEIQRRLQSITDVENKFSGMSIDSHRMFGDGMTGSKIMAGIGLTLGALGASGNGGNNMAAQAINKAIDRDIDVQKANIDKTGKEVDMARGGLRDYLATTHDMEASLTAEKARQLGLVQKQYEQIAAANASPQIKAQATQMAQTAAQERLKYVSQLESHTTSTVKTSMMPHMEAQVPADNDKVNNNIEVQAQTEKLMDLAKSFTGPVAGRLQTLKSRFGIQTADEKTFMQQSQMITDKIIHNIAGSRGMAPQEMQILQRLGLNMADKPEAFIAALKNIQNQASQENAAIVQTNAENHRYPMNVASRRAAVDRSTPDGLANHLGATPTLGMNTRKK